MPLQGADQELTTVFYASPGGPVVDPASVALTIRHNGADVVGPLEVTAGEIVHDGTGQFRYVWAIPNDQEIGTYLVEWSGVLPGNIAPSVGYETLTVTSSTSGDWVSLDDFKDSLANAGGAGSRTAAELPTDRLMWHLENAHTEVRGRLHAYTIPSPLDDAPALLRSVVTDFAAYAATLEWNGSQPLEDRDPIVLRYARALALLKALANGETQIEGVVPSSGTPTSDGYAINPVPNLNLAGGWAADVASPAPGYWHGMSQGL